MLEQNPEIPRIVELGKDKAGFRRQIRISGAMTGVGLRQHLKNNLLDKVQTTILYNAQVNGHVSRFSVCCTVCQ